LLKRAVLYNGIVGVDEKSVDIGLNKVVVGDNGIYITRPSGNICILIIVSIENVEGIVQISKNLFYYYCFALCLLLLVGVKR